LSAGSTILIDRRENPVEDEPLIDIRVIEGPPVPATVGGPEEEPSDESGPDAADVD
jgi:hypothetical protein